MKRKLIGAFLIVSLLVACTCGIAYSLIVKIDRSNSELLDTHVRIAQEAEATLAAAERQGSMLFHYMAEPDADKEKMMKDDNARLGDAITRLEGMLNDEDAKDKVRAIGDANTTFARLIVKVEDYIHSNKPDLAKAEALQWSAPAMEIIIKNSQDLRDQEMSIMEEKKADNQKDVDNVKQLFIAVTVGSLLVAVAVGLVLSRAIVNPIRQMVGLAGRIAACDLSGEDVKVRSRDEIGQLADALNGMKKNLQNVIRQVETSSELVASAADTLSSNSEEVSRSSEHITNMSQNIVLGTENQVTSVEQSADALQQMAVMMEGVAQSAQTTRSRSEQALSFAKEGDDAVRTAEEQMNAIFAKMNAIAESVRLLSERTGEILTINSLISQIARQTNILSVNASIEAARAGAEGRGFSVVAQEVRKLAGETAEAANRVGLQMEKMREEMNLVEQSTADGQNEAEQGIQVVRLAGDALSRIREASEASAQSVGEAAGRTMEAASLSASALSAVLTIQEIAREAADSAREVSACTEEQYAGMEEITSSANMLQRMAEELRDTISRFKME